MSINATIDSNKYEGIEKIEVGGKTIALEQTYNGSMSIVENGTHNVAGKAEVVVNVPTESGGGITPSGSINITTNGTHDVTTYASAVVNVPQTGYSINDFVESEGETAILHKVSNVEVETTGIRSYAFAGLNMYKVTAPNATKIGDYAFKGAGLMTELDAPNVTSIGKACFYGCGAMTKANFPLVTQPTIEGMFFNCTSLTEVNMDALTALGEKMFNSCKALQTISLPSVTKANYTEHFLGCTSLQNVELPLLTAGAQSMFKNCTSLEEISFPSITALGIYMFQGCTALKKVDLGETCTTIANDIFGNCTALETVILRRNGVVTAKQGMFSASTNGVTVYVPSSQISAYQADATWAKTGASGASNATFVAIEGSEFE